MTVIDITAHRRPRTTQPAAHRPAVGSVIDLPQHASRRDHEAGLAVEQLLMLLTQSIGLERHPSQLAAQRTHHRAQIAAYCFAIGIVVHPADPVAAQDTKAALVEAIRLGAKTADELTRALTDGNLPPTAG